MEMTERPLREVLPELVGRRGLRKLARAAGLSHSCLSHLIKGKRKPKIATLEKIAFALEVNPYFFLEYRQLQACQKVMKDPKLAWKILKKGGEIDEEL